MCAIFKREIKAYFKSAIAYVYLTVFLLFAGFLVMLNNISYSSGDMSGLYSWL